MLRTDVLVIGGGGAAIMAASRAAGQGRSVLMVSKTAVPGGSTVVARGGWQVACAVEDSPKLHLKDSINGGYGLARRSLLEAMTYGAPKVLLELLQAGAEFWRNADGSLNLKNIYGVSCPRHVHAADHTGIVLAKAFKRLLAKNGVEVLKHSPLVSLLVEDGKCVGAVFFNMGSGEFYPVQAKSVVLACGGGSTLYSLTDNLAGTDGDAYRAALEAGLPLVSMEMVEFQLFVCAPTCVHGLAPNSSAWVIRGGRLYNGLGERFMQRYSPENLEKSGRHLISKAVASEVAAGRGTSSGGVYLDVSDVPADVRREIAPTISKAFEKNGIDLRFQPLELGQGAHSFLGGVPIEKDASTPLNGLFAAGECAGGVHGAGRLGGNQLTSALVFGDIAGENAALYAGGVEYPPSLESLAQKQISILKTRFPSGAKAWPPELDAKKLRQVFSRCFGPLRNEQGLREGLNDLYAARERFDGIACAGKEDVLEKMRLHSLIQVGLAIGESALVRRESRGAHLRSDYPEVEPGMRALVQVQGWDALSAHFRSYNDIC